MVTPGTEPHAHADSAAPLRLATVVCGIDTSAESKEAARQAIRVADEDAQVWAVSVWDMGLAMHAGIHAGAVAAELREQAVTALHDANAAHHGPRADAGQGERSAGPARDDHRPRGRPCERRLARDLATRQAFY